MSDVFGTIKTGTEVEIAVMDTLRTWMPTVLQEIELQMGRVRGQIPPPKTYVTRKRFEGFPEDRMPLCVVVSSGLAEEPTADGERNYSAWFSMGVGCVASARDADAAAMLAKTYVAAARWILLNNQGLKDENGNYRASGVEWVDETYDDTVEATEVKTVEAAYGIFRIKVEDVVSRLGGPITPPDPVVLPGSQWPTADIVDITMDIVDDPTKVVI